MASSNIPYDADQHIIDCVLTGVVEDLVGHAVPAPGRGPHDGPEAAGGQPPLPLVAAPAVTAPRHRGCKGQQVGLTLG